MIRKIYTLNDFLKEKFNEKIYKVSLDGGFTCPNRDGKVSKCSLNINRHRSSLLIKKF